MLNKLLRIAGITGLLALTVFFSVCTYEALTLPNKVGVFVSAQTKAVGDRLSERDKQVAGLIKDLQDSWDDNYYDVKASNETTATILREVSEIVHTVRTKTLPDVNGLLLQSHSLVQSMQGDLGKITKHSGDTLDHANQVLENTSSLIQTLQEQVKVGSPEAIKTIQAATKSLDDLDKILANPSIKTTLDSTAKTSVSIAGSAESVDIALRPLREKARLLKVVLLKTLEVLKITVPFPGL